ncbi:hypothetical protein BLNAU_9659 [Blattamonas nauphoetae]|uniref:Uncharacterized protein n=1 Tax=Blattamonas nauphoetae TaxID=2049346 RepID=A0ABQ9XVC2_9EUKA|nr:hypothetical protein BLNAU_9659 [Blattamonas nauphoetae]
MKGASTCSLTDPVGCAFSPTSYQYTQYETELELAHLKQFYKIRTLRNSRDDCFVSNTTDAKANAHNCYGFCDGHQRMMPTLSCLKEVISPECASERCSLKVTKTTQFNWEVCQSELRLWGTNAFVQH